MSTWLLIALLPPLFWAISNTTDSILRRHHIKNDLTLTWYMAVSDTPTILILFILGGFQSSSLLTTLMLLLAGVSYTIPLYFYYKALEFEEISRITLLFQFIPLFTLAFAYFILSESLSTHEIGPFILILLGGILAALKKTKTKWHLSSALWLIGIASLFYSYSNTIFKALEPESINYFNAAAWYYCGRMIPALITSISKKQRKEIKQTAINMTSTGWKLLGINYLCDSIATISLTYALTLGKASLTNTLVGIQPLFVFLISILLAKKIPEIFKEDTSKHALIIKTMAIILIISGLYLLG